MVSSGDPDHGPVQRIFRLVNPGGVQKDQLSVRQMPDTQDLGSSGLRLVGNNCQFLLDQAIKKRGLADVGPACQRDEPGSECWRLDQRRVLFKDYC